jgi:hypothetical protein
LFRIGALLEFQSDFIDKFLFSRVAHKSFHLLVYSIHSFFLPCLLSSL